MLNQGNMYPVYTFTNQAFYASLWQKANTSYSTAGTIKRQAPPY